jgi:Tfp pilus assembly protein PilF
MHACGALYFSWFRRRALFAGILFCLFVPAAVHAESPALLYQEGLKALEKGDRENARYYFRKALEANPGYRAAALADGNLNLELGDLNRARASYNQVLSQEKDHAPALVGAARVETLAGNLSAANDLLARAEKQDPSHEDALHARGELNWISGRRDLAAGYFEKALRKNPGHLRSLLSLAVLETERGRTVRAASLIERAKRIEAENPEVYRAEGDISFRMLLSATDSFEKRRLADSAARSYRMALDIAPSSIPVQRNAVLLEMYTGRTSETAQRVRALIDQDGRNPSWHYLSAVLNHSKPGEALASFRQAMLLAPSDSFIRYRYETFLLSAPRASPPALRQDAARFHLRLMRAARTQGRADLRDYHAKRTLELNEAEMEALNLELETRRREGDFEGTLAALLRLRRFDESPSVNFRIDELLRTKHKDLAMREGLYSGRSPEYPSAFRRTPHRILVFDFRSETPFPAVPDAGQLIAQSIREHLEGKLAPVAEKDLRRVFTRVQAAQGTSGAVTYSPQAARFVEPGTAAVVGGTFLMKDGQTQVRFEIYDGQGGRLLERFDTQESGEDAVHRIGVRAAARLNSLLPARGTVIRPSSGGILLNVGRVDGLKVSSRVSIRRAGREVGRAKLVELSYLVSRAELEGVSSTSIFAGDQVILLPEEKKP